MKLLLFLTKPYSFPILEPVQEALKSSGTDSVAWYTASSAKNYTPPGTQLFSTEEVIEYNPDAVLVPGNIVPHYWPGLKVQIFHGIDDEPKGFYRITGFFDLYCTPGPAMTGRFGELAQKHGNFLVRETGWPKLDPVTKILGAKDQSISDFKSGFGLDPKKPVILYAPTFPPKYTSAPDLFQVISELRNDYQWLVKFHPLQDPEVLRKYENIQNDNFKICDQLNVIDYMQAADLMITDTSSVAYEFLPFNRPLVTYNAIARQDKGLNIDDPAALPEAIIRSLDAPAEFENQRKKYLGQIHPYSDGKSSLRIIDSIREIINSGEAGRLKPKPRNWVRKYQIRKLIG